ncbi:MAG: hypothetical protein M9962_04465 [Oligoflexia bacterium]|nr:hypothetical protein [Oligoflexia bacterium]
METYTLNINYRDTSNLKLKDISKSVTAIDDFSCDDLNDFYFDEIY